ncbi:MAG: DnaB-like helicase N-terminal domain-containing protein, partial [Thermodesulfobacteriota bacterium]
MEMLSRPLPQNIEAEQAVLGSIILESTVINQVLEILIAEDFYKDAHRKIFNAMVDLDRDNKPIDLLTLFDNLKSRGNLLEEVGESSYLTYLTELVPTTENVE